MSPGQYLRAADIADLLGLSTRTIRRWLADGTLPSTKIGGARLVLEQDLLARLGRSGDYHNGDLGTGESSSQIRQFSNVVKAQSE